MLPANPEPDARGRFPSWLHRNLPQGENLALTASVMRAGSLHTVCEEAKCPNRFECWSNKTATFLIMGKQCTRNCGFCSIDFSKSPQPLEALEPQHVAESVKALGLKHVVITMVARDDLPDGGATHLVETVSVVRRENPGVTIELLTSDFNGNEEAWKIALSSEPEIFNYNIETVRRLTPGVRHRATYDRTLQFLAHIKKDGRARYVKSGLMVGLGEGREEVEETLRELHHAGVSIVTIGQYLQPHRQKLLVKSFVTPDEFEAYAEYGRKLGILYMHCGPFVRSSYNAKALFESIEKSDRM